MKFCMSRVFRSLTKGSVDRTLLQKPTLNDYVRTLGPQLTQGYSDTGKQNLNVLIFELI